MPNYVALRGYIRHWQILIAPASPTAFSRFVQVLLAIGFALFNAAIVVQALNLYHALALRVHADDEVALAHGRAIFALEQRLHFAVEPAVQHALAYGLQAPVGVLAGTMLRHALVWIYLHAFPAWLLAALAWAYIYKPRQFAYLRDLTIVSALLAVLCYRIFPSAPPRFVLSGAPYHVQDWTYGGTAIDPNLVHVVGFNQFAAFPSVHFLWALIPALCLAYGSRSILIWLAALCFPLVMAVTVIGTGNHYVLDCAGSIAVLAASAVIVHAINHARRRLLRISPPERYELPAALSLCLCCAGTMAYAGIGGGVRHLVAADILILVVIASGRSPYLWRGRRRIRDRRVQPTRSDYVAGLLFIAGAAGAAHPPTVPPLVSAQVCGLLWLLASISALVRHMRVYRAPQSGAVTLRRYLPQLRRESEHDGPQLRQEPEPNAGDRAA